MVKTLFFDHSATLPNNTQRMSCRGEGGELEDEILIGGGGEEKGSKRPNQQEGSEANQQEGSEAKKHACLLIANSPD